MFRHFDDASMLNYSKQMTLYKLFDELFGHFSGDVCFNLAFCCVCIVRESKARRPGSGPYNRSVPFNGHVEFSKFQTGNFG